MGFIIGLLSFTMVLLCGSSFFLVLIQLPKKKQCWPRVRWHADGRSLRRWVGTVLTRITKYAATAFFVLALLLSILQSRYYSANQVASAHGFTGGGFDAALIGRREDCPPGSHTVHAVRVRRKRSSWLIR